MMPEAEPMPSRAPLVVLSRSSFEDALRDAFRAFTRPDKMAGNPLLRSRIVIGRTGLEADVADRIETLCGLLEETATSLEADPREARYYRAVFHTYLRPEPSQEQAADRLGLPFSTFRRHLKRGLDRVADILWDQEIGKD